MQVRADESALEEIVDPIEAVYSFLVSFGVKVPSMNHVFFCKTSATDIPFTFHSDFFPPDMQGRIGSCGRYSLYVSKGAWHCATDFQNTTVSTTVVNSSSANCY